ncbi:tryptophan 7-halogenase [Nocardia mangyaensis]|uniref:tryptophan 7-halogenase n=1 Tax=Nocardia mangyaensis TaxID=2213200 RepID=UPI0026766CA9|nr:tryptophan 7-halogenase [Nocardia mangyaensis]MDO3646417.1 tryptophan 7-halogenase [Nocardia mangyaensis]
MSSTESHKIVVLGAGYAGMIAATYLTRGTRKANVDITLVNPSPRFTERPIPDTELDDRTPMQCLRQLLRQE